MYWTSYHSVLWHSAHRPCQNNSSQNNPPVLEGEWKGGKGEKKKVTFSKGLPFYSQVRALCSWAELSFQPALWHCANRRCQSMAPSGAALDPPLCNLSQERRPFRRHLRCPCNLLEEEKVFKLKTHFFYSKIIYEVSSLNVTNVTHFFYPLHYVQCTFFSTVQTGDRRTDGQTAESYHSINKLYK